MKTVQISLDSIDKVREFVQIITLFDSDFDMRSGRYTVDAKSILGIFSLDLSKPIDLDIYGEEALEDVLKAIEPFMVS
ncbi:MAG: HPr family phosphocarrier protein [Lachnospiraceae bacterium]|nr:HPr family phosphocarrier protein [Lachnospiraceae bacterium]